MRARPQRYGAELAGAGTEFDGSGTGTAVAEGIGVATGETGVTAMLGCALGATVAG
jgi:hypothetical protein